MLALMTNEDAMQATKGEEKSVVLPNCKAYKTNNGQPARYQKSCNSGTFFFLSWALGGSCLMGPKIHSVSFKTCWYYIHAWCCIPSQLPMAKEITDHREESPSVIFLS